MAANIDKIFAVAIILFVFLWLIFLKYKPFNFGQSDRITKRITLPSPTLQVFLKNIMFNDEEYLTFLENTQVSFAMHGIELGADVSENLLIDFRIAIDRARELIANGGQRLKFEDVFNLPSVVFENGHLRLSKADTSVDVYYSTTHTEENRGRDTSFDPKRDTVATRESSSEHTTKFDGTSIFDNDYRRERFIRSPLLSSEILTQIINSIQIKGPLNSVKPSL